MKFDKAVGKVIKIFSIIFFCVGSLAAFITGAAFFANVGHGGEFALTGLAALVGGVIVSFVYLIFFLWIWCNC